MGLRQRNNKIRSEILELTPGPDGTGERRGGGREWSQKSSCDLMWFHRDGDGGAGEEETVREMFRVNVDRTWEGGQGGEQDGLSILLPSQWTDVAG